MKNESSVSRIFQPKIFFENKFFFSLFFDSFTYIIIVVFIFICELIFIRVSTEVWHWLIPSFIDFSQIDSATTSVVVMDGNLVAEEFVRLIGMTDSEEIFGDNGDWK